MGCFGELLSVGFCVNYLCKLAIDMQGTNGAVVSMVFIIYVCIESSLCQFRR